MKRRLAIAIVAMGIACRRNPQPVRPDPVPADVAPQPTVRIVFGKVIDVRRGVVLRALLDARVILEIDESEKNDRAVLLSEDGRLHAVTVSRAGELWSAATGKCSALFVDGSAIYCVGEASVTAVDGRSGKILWTFGGAALEAAAVDGAIAIRVGESTLTMLDSATGVALVSKKMPEWAAYGPAHLLSSPDRNSVCVVGMTTDGEKLPLRCGCYDTNTLSPRWTKSLVLPNTETTELRQLGPNYLVVGVISQSPFHLAARDVESTVVRWSDGTVTHVNDDIAATLDRDGAAVAYVSPRSGYLSLDGTADARGLRDRYASMRLVQTADHFYLWGFGKGSVPSVFSVDRKSGKRVWSTKGIELVDVPLRFELVDGSLIVTARARATPNALVIDAKTGAVLHAE